MSIEIIARAVLIRQGHVLLCRNAAKGYRYLPGGHVELGESAAAAAARELIEEADLVIRVGPLVAIAEVAFGRGKKRTHELNLVFRAEHPGRTRPRVVSQEPDIAFDWVPLDELAAADMRPTCLAHWLGSVYDARSSEIAHLRDGLD